MKNNYNVNNFNEIALFSLFATSYIPLFILIGLKQILVNNSFGYS